MSAVKHRQSTRFCNRHRRPMLCIAASVCYVGLPSFATAQTRDTKVLEEITVTAQRREEDLQKVPISITVLSGSALDASTANGVTEALNRVAGVATTIASQGGGTQLSVRGVTAGGPLFNGSSPIAYYLDTVPFGLVKTAIAPDANAYDLDRIEVLRGPQGTLYGASAQNGVVRIITHDADLEHLELKVRTSLSSTQSGGENYRGDAALNVPVIAGKAAVRAVVGYQDESGWIDGPLGKDVNDAERKSTRVKFNAQPTEALSIGLSAWVSRVDEGATPSANNDSRYISMLDEPIDTDYDVYGLTVRYDFAAATLAATTGYLDYANNSLFDLTFLGFTGTSLYTGLRSKILEQEVTLSSTAKGDIDWRWSVGGMYRDAEDRLLQTLPGFPVPLPPTDYSDTSESVAVFGELTRIFMDGRVELTGGLRYFEDDVAQIENVASDGSGSVLPPSRRTFDATSPRVVLSLHPNATSTLYASYAEGFRSGFSQNANVTRSSPGFPPLESDNLINYEVGAKQTVAGGRLSYEVALYYMDWQDVQQTATVLSNGLPVTALVNGKSASGMGVDAGLTAQVTDALAGTVSASWNDLAIDSDVFSFPQNAPPGGVILFHKGDRLNQSPEYTISAGADYQFPVGGNLNARLSASGTYISEQNVQALLGTTHVDALGDPMTIARVAVALAAERWTATLFADNVTDERGAAVRGVLLPEAGVRARPRTIGLQLEYNF